MRHSSCVLYLQFTLWRRPG